jgi:hypothetical protein
MDVVVLLLVVVWFMCIGGWVLAAWMRAVYGDVIIALIKNLFFHAYKLLVRLSKKLKNY